jgi:hypothetical protein
MLVQRALIATVAFVALLLGLQLPRGECVALTARSAMKPGRAELVFSGRVVNVARSSDVGYWATFDVDRVWKGAVSKRIDLYVWLPSPEVPSFEPGGHYVALAKPLTDMGARLAAGVADPEMMAFAPIRCSAYLAPDIAGELGVGALPQ